MSPIRLALGILICLSGPVASLELAPYPLPDELYPSREYVSVSGIGSGGVFAQIFHFAYSTYVKGVAVYSSTFYACGSGSSGYASDYLALCTRNSPLPYDKQYQVEQTVAELQSYGINKQIDDIQHLRDSRLYVYCSLRNPEYSAFQQLAIVSLYEKYLASPYFIETRVQDTAEFMPVFDTSDSYNEGPTCPNTYESDGTLPSNCTNLSVPGEALSHLLGYLYQSGFVNPFYPYRQYVRLEPLRSFNQTEFTLELDYTDLDDVGYYYIPHYCLQRSYGYGYSYGYGKRCLVHIYFHGCYQGRQYQGTSHVKHSNYLEIAEVNSIIILFPQAISSERNPDGCWDYTGLSGTDYVTKSGSQIEAIYRMLARLLYLPISIEKPSSSYSSSNPSPSSYPIPPSPTPSYSPPSSTPSYSPASSTPSYSPPSSTPSYSPPSSTPSYSPASSTPSYSPPSSTPSYSPPSSTPSYSPASSTPSYSPASSTPSYSPSSSTPSYSPASSTPSYPPPSPIPYYQPPPPTPSYSPRPTYPLPSPSPSDYRPDNNKIYYGGGYSSKGQHRKPGYGHNTQSYSYNYNNYINKNARQYG